MLTLQQKKNKMKYTCWIYKYVYITPLYIIQWCSRETLQCLQHLTHRIRNCTLRHSVLQMLPKNCKMESARGHSWPVRKGSRSCHNFSSQQTNAKNRNIRIGFLKPFQCLWASWSPPHLCFQQNGSPESTHSSFGVANVFFRKNILCFKNPNGLYL